MKITRSAPVFFNAATSSIDEANGVIKDIVILQSGKDKYNEQWDKKALEQLVTLGNAQGQGVKSRFGHPNMCDTTLGSFIGRYKNHRVSTTTRTDDGVAREVPCVVADLHLDPVAKESPKGNLYDYVLSMSAKNSDMFGNSIVFMPDESEVVLEKTESGEEKEVKYMRVKSYLASDLVDSPAATDSLFKDTTDFAAIATQFLEENPGIYEVLSKNDGIVKEFLSKYEAFKTQKLIMTKKNEEKSFLAKLKEMISGADVKESSPEIALATHKTATGETINIDGPVAEGSVVSDADGNPTPNASYTLEDGTAIETDADSKITKVTAKAEEAKPDEVAKEILSLKEQNQKLLDAIAAEKAEREAEQKEISAQVEKLVAENTELKKKMVSKEVVPTGGTAFAREKKNETGKENRVKPLKDQLQKERQATA